MPKKQDTASLQVKQGQDTNKQQTSLKTSPRRSTVMMPITWLEYQAAWAAFQDRPSVGHVAKQVGITIKTAQTLVDEGWPELGLQPLSARLAKVNKIAQQIEDYNLSQAMAQNAGILRGMKVRLVDAMGRKGMTNLTFNPESFKDLTPKDALVFAKFLDQMFRLEAFVLRKGADKNIVDRRDRKPPEDSVEKESGKIAKTLNTLKQIIEKSPFCDCLVEEEAVVTVVDSSGEEEEIFCARRDINIYLSDCEDCGYEHCNRS